MTRTRIHPNEETVKIQARVPASVKEWLERDGNLSKMIRRLVKEEQWAEEAKVEPGIKATMERIESLLEKLKK